MDGWMVLGFSFVQQHGWMVFASGVVAVELVAFRTLNGMGRLM